MPIGLVSAGVAAAGAIGGAIISSNSSKSAANTTAAASRDAQQEQARQFDAGTAEQARQFDAAQAALREGTANANFVQGQQHDASLGILSDGAARSIGEQRAALADASGIQRGLYDTAVSANQPFLNSGTSALNRLAQTYGLDYTNGNGEIVQGNGAINTGDFYKSPDYQFRLNEGIKGVDAGASARGMLDSGATRKAEIKYAGNLAAGEFGSYASRLAQLAGIGQAAAGNAASSAANYGNAISNLRTGVANNISNTLTGTAGRLAGANDTYATQYGNAQLGLGTNLADTSTAYGNNFANAGQNYASGYASSVMNAANNQANAQLVQGANTSNAINGFAGQAGSFLNGQYPGRSVFSSSYVPTQGGGKYESVGLY